MSAPPFFIVGNDRSGTTMLRIMLDRSPEVAVPPESMFLTDYADVRAAGGLEDPARLRSFAREVWEHPKVLLWKLGPGPPEPPAGLDHAAAYRWAVEAPFAAYAARHSKPRWGDKTPHYVHHVDELLAVWPEARFVVLVRDGRDVALSVRDMPFGPNNAWAAASWWARGIRAGEAAERRHPERVMSVRYEDIVAAPATALPRICAWVGVPYTEDLLALEKADRGAIVPDQRGWFPTLFTGVNASAVARWRREMRPSEQGVFAALAGDELAAWGYPVPTRPPRRPPTGLRAWLLRQHNQLLRHVNFVRLRVIQERGRELAWARARRRQDRSR